MQRSVSPNGGARKTLVAQTLLLARGRVVAVQIEVSTHAKGHQGIAEALTVLSSDIQVDRSPLEGLVAHAPGRRHASTPVVVPVFLFQFCDPSDVDQKGREWILFRGPLGPKGRTNHMIIDAKVTLQKRSRRNQELGAEVQGCRS